MVDVRGDGDAIAARFDAPGGLFDARALGRRGGGTDGDVAAGEERAGREKCAERICKPNSVLLEEERGSFICHARCRGGRATYPEAHNGNGRFHDFPIWSCSAGGLPCRRRSRGTRCALTAPFHPCLLPGLATETIGGLLSVALSVALPRLAVSQPAARGSSDFPPPYDGDPPIRSTRSSLTGRSRWKLLLLNCCCFSSLE